MDFLYFLADLTHGLVSAIGFIVCLVALLWIVDKVWTRIQRKRIATSMRRHTARGEFRATARRWP